MFPCVQKLTLGPLIYITNHYGQPRLLLQHNYYCARTIIVTEQTLPKSIPQYGSCYISLFHIFLSQFEI